MLELWFGGGGIIAIGYQDHQEASDDGYEQDGEVFVAGFVGVDQGASGNTAPDAQVIPLGRMGSQAGFDVPQAFAKSQLGKPHA